MLHFLVYAGPAFLLLMLPSPSLALILPSIPDFLNSALASPLIGLVNASSKSGLPALISNYSLNVSYSTPVCDGNLLGFDMNRYSCLQAWNTIPTTQRSINFGDRLDGTFDVQLPRRFSGRECLVVF